VARMTDVAMWDAGSNKTIEPDTARRRTFLQ